MVICPDCGKEVKEAKFCSNCGANISDVVAQEEDVVEEIEVSNTHEDEIEDVNISEDESESSSEELIETQILKKTKFCQNCGTEVDVETAFCPKCGFKFIQDETPQTKFCQNCGEKININAEICPHCGGRVANFTSSVEKSTVISAILSFLFPGLGHLYLGLTKKGISFIIAYIVSAILIFLLIGFVLIFVVWIWALIDSIKSTEAINNGEFVEDKLF